MSITDDVIRTVASFVADPYSDQKEKGDRQMGGLSDLVTGRRRRWPWLEGGDFQFVPVVRDAVTYAKPRQDVPKVDHVILLSIRWWHLTFKRA